MRYKASEEVGHSCCYSASVIDMTKPTYYDDVFEIQHYHVICECCDMKIAENIAEALNKYGE